jgi:hypothetical protein
VADPFPVIGIVGTCPDRPLFERAAGVCRYGATDLSGLGENLLPRTYRGRF